MDRWECYERSVQSATDSLALLLHEHGGDPRTLAEDFAGSAALARAWAASAATRTALAIDLDAQALAHAAGVERVQGLVADVRAVRHEPVDAIHAGNFSLGYLHTRAELLAYLRRVAARLRPDGLFACDTYGGASAFELGVSARVTYLADGRKLTTLWERRAADARTARVENVLGFRVELEGDVVALLPEAFVYRWRLWSIPELADALEECGFAPPRVRSSTADDAAQDGALGADWAVMLCAKRATS